MKDSLSRARVCAPSLSLSLIFIYTEQKLRRCLEFFGGAQAYAYMRVCVFV